jgi:SAM-dependent methyltransferase
MHNIQVDIVADLNKGLPIENEVCNTVISISVLEHLRAPQMMVNEAYRILKKGGTIILQVPWQWWIHEAPYDFHRYTPYGLTYLLEKAGFNGIKVSAQSGFFTMVILKFNYFTRRFVHGSLFLRTIILAVLIPFWYIGQLTAPLLDKLDRNWDLETSGYFIMAHKR